MTGADAFSDDYRAARDRFRSAATRAGFQVEQHPVESLGPDRLPLSVDTARIGDASPSRLVVVSSGLHGVEGFFGSAAQVYLLEEALRDWCPPAELGLVFVHALNPYGFAHIRRFDEENVDLNRNFLLPGEAFQGCPPRYGALDSFLNPRYPPSYLDPFLLKAILAIARYGFHDLKQAVAGGQYEYPRGIFFGGHEPASVHRRLETLLPRWVGDAEAVIHVDFHTGLGAWGDWHLLLESCVGPERRAWLTDQFGTSHVQGPEPNGISYQARGGLGTWCESLFPHVNYTLLCAEFGTYAPLNVLRALRDENQAHQWGTEASTTTARAKAWLKEAFAPADVGWRNSTVPQGAEIVTRLLTLIRDRLPPAHR